MTSPTIADAATVRKEAEVLRAMLETLISEYRTTRSEVTLSAWTSEPVKAFWEVIGYSTVFRPFANSPDDVSGRKEVEQILKGWRVETPSRNPIDRIRKLLQRAPEPIRIDQLPRRFRYVGVSERWDAFYLTDESGSGDPPVLSVTRNPPGIQPGHPSYLRRVAAGLLQKAFIMSGADLKLSPPKEGTRPLPTLAPQLMQLADGIWRLTPSSDRDNTAGRVGDVDKIGFASWDRLVEYVYSVEDCEMKNFQTTNGCFVPMKTEMKPVVINSSKLRNFTYKRDGHDQVELVGWIGEMPAWVTLDLETQEMTGVSVHIENRDRMLAWIDANFPYDDDDDKLPEGHGDANSAT